MKSLWNWWNNKASEEAMPKALDKMEYNQYQEALNDNHIFDEKKRKELRLKIDACNLYCKPVKKVKTIGSAMGNQYDHMLALALEQNRGASLAQRAMHSNQAYYGQSRNIYGGLFG